jgi:hypothetical protein
MLISREAAYRGKFTGMKKKSSSASTNSDVTLKAGNKLLNRHRR